MSDPQELPEFEEEGGPVKSFLDHLEDLRWVLIKSCAAVAIGVLLCLIAGDKIVGILKWPLKQANKIHFKSSQSVTFKFGTNRLGTFTVDTNVPGATLLTGGNARTTIEVVPVQVGTNTLLALQVSTNQINEATSDDRLILSNFSPTDGFFVAFQVALYGGILLASPFIFFQLAQFIFPALKMNEKKYIGRGLAVGLGLFLSGAAFCYFFLLPMALNASVSYSNWLGFDANNWRADEYITFVCKFILGMGLGFEMPVVILILVRLGIVTANQLAAFRRYMIVINLILGAVLTTPEVITQIMMALPLQILYEISILIARYMERKERLRQESEA